MTDPTEPLSPPIPATRVPPPPTPPGGSSGLGVYAAIGCAAATFLLLCAGGGSAVIYGLTGAGGVSGGTGRVVRIRGTVSTAMGPGGVGPGASCELPVEEVREADGTVVCHVVVTCAGMNLYGDGRTGYFPCTFAPGSVTGGDPSTSSLDRDGAFSVSTSLRTFEVHDDGSGPLGTFAVSGTITSVE